MRLRCSSCGKSVSTEVPDGTIIRAYIECQECIEAKANSPKCSGTVEEREDGTKWCRVCKSIFAG